MFSRTVLLGCLLSAAVATAAPIEIVRVDQVSPSEVKQGATAANVTVAPGVVPKAGAPGGMTLIGAAALAAEPNRTAKPSDPQAERLLNIQVRNTTDIPQAATARYWFIGRDMTSMKVGVMDGGEAQVTLKANAAQTVTSESAKGTYKPRAIYTKVTGTYTAGPVVAAGAKAEGVRIVGYGIQLIQNGKVIHEKFSEPSYKKLTGSDGFIPGALFKTKEDKPAE